MQRGERGERGGFVKIGQIFTKKGFLGRTPVKAVPRWNFFKKIENQSAQFAKIYILDKKLKYRRQVPI